MKMQCQPNVIKIDGKSFSIDKSTVLQVRHIDHRECDQEILFQMVRRGKPSEHWILTARANPFCQEEAQRARRVGTRILPDSDVSAWITETLRVNEVYEERMKQAAETSAKKAEEKKASMASKRPRAEEKNYRQLPDGEWVPSYMYWDEID